MQIHLPMMCCNLLKRHDSGSFWAGKEWRRHNITQQRADLLKPGIAQVVLLCLDLAKWNN